MRILVANTLSTSLNDVIGEVSFVIWLCGCNFKCPYCQNWPLVIDKGGICVAKDVDNLINEIEQVRTYIGYVQVTGGEPTLQGDSVQALFSRVKRIGLNTSLDTNGSHPQVINTLIRHKLLDHLAMDVKARLEPHVYSRVIGLPTDLTRVYLKKILNSLELASKLDFVEIRTTYVPSLLTQEDIIKIADMLSSYLTKKKHFYVIQQFVPNENAPDPRFRRGSIPSVEELLSIARKVADRLPNVAIRHIGGVDYIK